MIKPANKELAKHKLRVQTKLATLEELKEATAVAEGKDVAEAEAGPVAPGFPPYPWWNILTAGPYQPFAAVGPNKNMQAGNFAFMAGALWLNPAGILWGPPPSAAQVMGAFDMQINFETFNLSTGLPGPAIPPIVMNPIGAWVGPPWFKMFSQLLGPGVFPVPDQGRPHLYELNVTADVSGPVPQPFFAGYSTWVFDPDIEPAVWPPFIPGWSRPATPPHWHYNNPCRFLVYRA